MSTTAPSTKARLSDVNFRAIRSVMPFFHQSINFCSISIMFLQSERGERLKRSKPHPPARAKGAEKPALFVAYQYVAVHYGLAKFDSSLDSSTICLRVQERISIIRTFKRRNFKIMVLVVFMTLFNGSDTSTR